MLTTDNSVMRYQIVPTVVRYTISYSFWDFSEIVVMVTNPSTGETVTLKRDVDYMISVSEPLTDRVYQGGLLTMISDVFKGYSTLVIQRVIPLTQETDFENSEPIDAELLENTLDRMEAQIQQQQEELKHTLQVPIAEDHESAQEKLLQIIQIGNQVTEDKEHIDNMVQQSEDILSQMEGMLHPGYRETIGDGATAEFTINHNLNAEWVSVQVWWSDLAKAYPYQFKELDKNSIRVTFAKAPEFNSAEIRIISSERVDIPIIGEDVKLSPPNLTECTLSSDEIAEIIGTASNETD